jgi:hypothetical protein
MTALERHRSFASAASNDEHTPKPSIRERASVLMTSMYAAGWTETTRPVMAKRDDAFHCHARIPHRRRLALARRVRHVATDAERPLACTEHHERAGVARQRVAGLRTATVRRRAVSGDALREVSG